MAQLSYPTGGDFTTEENLGGFLNFKARPFENTLDDQAETTGDAGSVHDISLPYTNVVSSESSVWDSGDNDGFWGYTDADTGASEFIKRVAGSFVPSPAVDQVQMELSMAGYKQPTLRQRHYSWNLVNREEKDGQEIAEICRAFQASVYGRIGKAGKGGMDLVGNEQVMPPPMWNVTFLQPDKSNNKLAPAFEDFGSPNSGQPDGGGFSMMGMASGLSMFGLAGAIIGGFGSTDSRGGDDAAENLNEGPQARPGLWRWHMDQFLSVLVRAEISPTKSTDGTMVKAANGFPLVTSLSLSFMEVAQVVANQNWTHIIPYSFATDKDSPGYAGEGGPFSPL